VKPLSLVARNELVATAARTSSLQFGDCDGQYPRVHLRNDLSCLIKSPSWESWRKNNNSGIVHLPLVRARLWSRPAVAEWTAEGRPALILVPGQDLHVQWAPRDAEELPDCHLLLAGARSPTAIMEAVAPSVLQADPPISGRRVVLVTNTTAASSDFVHGLRTAIICWWSRMNAPRR